MELDGRSVVVTGAGRGLGRAIALRLARGGAKLAVTDLNEANAKLVAGEISAAGGQALALRCDVTTRSECERVVDEACAAFGRLDAAICNAGIIQLKPLLEITEADWDPVFAVNTRGAFFTAQAAGRRIIEQRQNEPASRAGRIVMMASIAGRYGAGAVAPLIPHYRASKAAVVSLAQTLAYSFAPHVRVNAICPGMVGTDMWAYIDREWSRHQGWEPGEATRKRAGSVLVDRPQTPEDVAELAAFLLSDAADYITGQSINVDGGTILS